MKTQWLYGIHTIHHYLENYPQLIKQVVMVQTQTGHSQRLCALETELLSIGLKVQKIKADKLDQLTDGGNHQGCAIEVVKNFSKPSLAEFLEKLTESTSSKSNLILVLDRIVDPQNLGSCFRSAFAAGTDAIIATKWQSAEITPTVRKISCGATEEVPFFTVCNLPEVLKKLQKHDFECIGFDANAPTSLYDLKASNSKSVALVFGNEHLGLRKHVALQCDALCKIPMYSQAESLNVATAAAIGCFEMRRQLSL